MWEVGKKRFWVLLNIYIKDLIIFIFRYGDYELNSLDNLFVIVIIELVCSEVRI